MNKFIRISFGWGGRPADRRGRPPKGKLTWFGSRSVSLSLVVLFFVIAFLATAAGSLEGGRAPERKGLFAAAPGSPIQVGGMPGSIVRSDVNQDGKPDLVVASSPGITVL